MTANVYGTSLASLLGWLNVKAYGATGNGSTDDTAAIQAAQAALPAAGGVIYFPQGTYKISSALTVTSKTAFVGCGDTVSVIVQSSTSANCLAGTDLQNVTISDLGLTGPGSGTGNGIAFTLVSNSATLYITMRNVTVKNFGGDGINMQIPIVSSFDRVVAQSCGGYGFDLYGITTGGGSPGTSCSLRACYGNGNTLGGYRLYKLSYTALNACAADNQPIGYLIDQGWNVTLTGCGAEGNTTGVKINGGYGNSVFSQFIYNNQGTGIWVTGTAHLVGLYQVVDVTPGGSATNFLKVDAGSFATIVGQSNTTANALNGTINILDDGANGIDIAGYAYLKTTLELGANLLLDAGLADITNSSTSATALQAKVSGDTQERFQLLAGGGLKWGPGNAALDTTAGRAGAGVWYTAKNALIGASTALGDNGAGEIQLADATTVPTTNPSAGTVMYSESSTPHPVKVRDTSGNVRSLVDGYFQLASSPTFTSASQTATTVTLAVAASATYLMEAAIIFANTTGITTPSWTGPTGATMQWCDTSASTDYSSTIGATNNSYAANAATRMAFFKGLLVTSTTAGSLTLTLGVSAGTTTLSAGSYLRLTRVK